MRNAITAVAMAAMILSAGPAGASSICGDVNDSSSVTASDALSVLKAAVGQAVELLCSSSAQLPRTGQTSDYGPGSDGVVQAGVARSFTDNGDGTVTDNVTGLMWEKKDDSGGIHDKDNSYTWSTEADNMNGTIATVFLATLNSGDGFADHNDWRIPNIVELQSLVNFDVDAPTAYPQFHTNCAADCTATTCSCTSPSYYWSSSTYQSHPLLAWDVHFLYGDARDVSKVDSNYVRAVRAGS